MAKIPLTGVFEKYLGIGKINSKEELLALAARLREEDRKPDQDQINGVLEALGEIREDERG